MCRPMNVLLIEDNPPDAEIVRLALDDDPASAWNLRHASNIKNAASKHQMSPVDVVLLDLGLEESDGIDTFREASEHFPQTPIIILSALDSVELAENAVEQGAQDFLLKDEFNAERLRRCLRYAVRRPLPTGDRETTNKFIANNGVGAKQGRELRLVGELYESSPADFDRFVNDFEELIQFALKQRMFETPNTISDRLSEFGKSLFEARASALDLVDIQRIAANNMAIGRNRRRQLAQAEEGRLLLIGVMAQLTDFYRSCCMDRNS